jgi:hypothetical protein
MKGATIETKEEFDCLRKEYNNSASKYCLIFILKKIYNFKINNF